VAAHFAYLHDLFEGNAEMIQDLVVAARRHDARGAHAMARERLETLFLLIDDLCSRANERLDEWLVVCRAALALYPLPALPRAQFRLRSMRGLAIFHSATHLVPVTSAERFRLRLRVLGLGFRQLRRVARREVHAVKGQARQAAGRLWRRAEHVAHDFNALSSEALATAEGLLRVVGARAPNGGAEQ
jgi:hypothetical protein